ncbi:MAG: 23S rRNA (guanosine(2251)-2'-O)-methyltransferase RlmB [Clostridia bacterium]|nr:23S rRNA (guanosine(2251)-2'-O)-methyltransferase RlmB [Clostridia bacterium]
MDRKNTDKKPNNDLIIGRNAVREALNSGRAIDHLLVAKGVTGGSVSQIIALCRKNNIPVKEADSKKLDFLCGNDKHQGVALFAAAHEYASMADIYALAAERGEPLFVILCDGLEDPHNLGAVIRSAEAAGAHGVIIPEHRSVSLSSYAGKAAAGALEYVPVVRVKNLNNTVKELKEKGVWVYAADMDGAPYYETDMSGPAALIIGSEGKGISRLMRENADIIVSVPMYGHINSLNASVAGGILMFEITKSRHSKRA